MLVMFKVSVVQLDEQQGELIERFSFEHNFPPNCIEWIPDLVGFSPHTFFDIELNVLSVMGLRFWEKKSGLVPSFHLTLAAFNGDSFEVMFFAYRMTIIRISWRRVVNA